MAPITDEKTFREGVDYATVVIKQLWGDSLPLDISESTIRTFISDTQKEDRTKNKARYNTKDFDIEDIIKHKKGVQLLDPVVPRSSEKNAALAMHFQTFENPIMQLCALTILTLSEREAQREMNESAPIELTPNAEKVLRYA